MSAESNALGLARPTRWRYSLRTLLLVVFFVALGLTDFRLRGGGWQDAWNIARMVLSAALIWGLTEQMRDFQQAAKRPLSRDARWGLRAAIGWRAAAALMLVAFHVVEHFPPAEETAVEWMVITSTRFPVDSLYYLALILIIAGTRQLASKPAKVPSMLRSWLDVFALAVLLSVFLYDRLAIHFFVYLALIGIEVSRSPIRVPLLEGVDPLPITRAEPAFWLGLGAAVLIPISFGLIYLCSREIASRRGRCLVCASLVFALFAMTSMFCWNYFVALPTAAPWLLAQASEASAWHIALVGVPFFLFLTTAVAYRWSARATAMQAPTSEAPPSRHPYLHERRWLISLVAITLVLDALHTYFGASLYHVYHSLREKWLDFVSFGKIWLDAYWWIDIAWGVIHYPLPIATLVVVLHGALAQWRRRLVLSPAPAPELSPCRFVFVWLAVAATTAVAIPSLAIYGFVLWMAPWYL